MGFHLRPVNGVLAPVPLVRRSPLLGPLGALATVRPGRYSDQMVRVVQIVGIFRLPGRLPSPPSGYVSVLERDQVVDVQVSRQFYVDPSEGPVPPAGLDPTHLGGFKGNFDQAFGYQDLLPGVLAVSVLVDPVLPLGPTVIRYVRRDGGHGYG